MQRTDGRAFDELRPIRITTGYTEHAPGSVLIEFGKTRVLCTAMVEPKVPPFLIGRGTGWLTAEYAMLPSSTISRKRRENYKNGPDGRSTEISRLIGRSLRCGIDLSHFGERTLAIDCDVIQADGGTRTASITGGYVAMAVALYKLRAAERCLKPPVAAISCGVVDNELLLDLCYDEDSSAQADVNLVMAGEGFVEIQGTGEKRPVSREELYRLLDMGELGIMELFEYQKKAIDEAVASIIKQAPVVATLRHDGDDA